MLDYEEGRWVCRECEPPCVVLVVVKRLPPIQCPFKDTAAVWGWEDAKQQGTGGRMGTEEAPNGPR